VHSVKVNQYLKFEYLDRLTDQFLPGRRIDVRSDNVSKLHPMLSPA